MRQRTDTAALNVPGCPTVGAAVVGKIFQETEMSKGNKESKKPKQGAPAKTPATGGATPTPVTGSKPLPRKKWPTT